MAQSQAAQQASQEQPKQEEQVKQESQPSIQDVLKQTLSPLSQAVSSLQSQLDELKSTQRSQVSDDAEKNLKKAASLDRLFDDVDEDKFERLSNKQLMDVIADAVDGAMKANSELVKQDIVKMSSADKRRFEELEKATMSVIAHMGVAEARKKFTDFDVYKDDIGKVLEQYPNVGYEDAYLMAKSRKAGAVPPRSSVESEKPDSFGTAPTGPKGNELEGYDAFAKIAARGRRTGGRQTEGQNSQSGVVGFRSFADAAIEKYLDSLD